MDGWLKGCGPRPVVLYDRACGALSRSGELWVVGLRSILGRDFHHGWTYGSQWTSRARPSEVPGPAGGNRRDHDRRQDFGIGRWVYLSGYIRLVLGRGGNYSTEVFEFWFQAFIQARYASVARLFSAFCWCHPARAFSCLL